MGINIRQKGQEGEREVAKILNTICNKVRSDLGYPALAERDYYFQRNQNQSAVGGDDLTSVLPLSFEVKRQEQLSINTWWKQCVQSAERQGNIPILIYRQNRKAWKVVMLGKLDVQSSTNNMSLCNVRVEVDLDTFKNWFAHYFQEWIIRHS